MKDNYGRKIDYLRISLTDRCNLRCIYCMPEEGVPFRSHESVLRIEEIADFTRRAVKAGIRRVRLTGGEPLVRKGVVDLIREINDIPEIEDISLTTNGILLPKMASELRDAGLTRVNISLDTLDPAQFSYVTRLGKIEDVFAGIDAAFEHGFDPVKINAVAVRGLDQDFFAFAKLTLGSRVDRRRYHPGERNHRAHQRGRGRGRHRAARTRGRREPSLGSRARHLLQASRRPRNGRLH